MIFLCCASTLLCKYSSFRRAIAAPTFIKNEIFVTLYKLLGCVTTFEDEIVNNNAFEHTNLIFTAPWALTNEIMLSIMQNFKFDFLKSEF